MRAIERWRVGRAVAGDAREAERIVREHYPAVLRLLKHLTGRHEEAADLAQKTFLRAHGALPEFRFECPLRNWFLRIAVREYLNWKRNVRTTLPLEETLVGPGINPDLLLLSDALAALGAELREPFLLRNVEGLSTRETAEVLGIPEGTVKSRCYSARAQLQLALGGHEPSLQGAKSENA